MQNAIEITKVSKKFGSKWALKDVSLQVPAGQIFGFLGPNGAGKSTTIRCLMDYIRPSSGSMRLLGKDSQKSSAELKKQIGYLSSDLQLYPNWTVQTHLDFVGSIKGGGPTKELLQRFKLDTHPKVRHLSTGNKQKLAIILAFMGKPKLLLMDEPTRGLDPLLQNELYALLKEFEAGGGTVFFSSHNLAEVQQLCQNVAVIREGSIVAAKTMAELLNAKLHTITAITAKPLKEAALKLPGVTVLSHNSNNVSLKVSGPINDVMHVLTAQQLTDLEVTHASLEDVFMEYY